MAKNLITFFQYLQICFAKIFPFSTFFLSEKRISQGNIFYVTGVKEENFPIELRQNFLFTRKFRFEEVYQLISWSQRREE